MPLLIPSFGTIVLELLMLKLGSILVVSMYLNKAATKFC